MRSYIAVCLILLGGSRPAAATKLSDPIRTLISGPDVRFLYKDTGLTPASPIRTVVESEFYRDYVRPHRTSFKGDSPFYREQRGWTAILARALGRKQLAFDMSPEDIRAFEENQPRGVMYLSMQSLMVLDADGRLPMTGFEQFGVYLVADFVRMYREELALPEVARFMRDHEPSTELVLLYKRAVDQLLASGGAAPVVPPTSADLADVPAVLEWLEHARANAESPAAVKLACEVLLEHLGRR